MTNENMRESIPKVGGMCERERERRLSLLSSAAAAGKWKTKDGVHPGRQRAAPSVRVTGS